MQRKQAKSRTEMPLSLFANKSPSNNRFLQGLEKSRAALNGNNPIFVKPENQNHTPLIFLNSLDSTTATKPQVESTEAQALKLKCEELEEVNRILRSKLQEPNRRQSVRDEADIDGVGEEGSAQVIHSPIVKRGKSTESPRKMVYGKTDMAAYNNSSVAKQLLLDRERTSTRNGLERWEEIASDYRSNGPLRDERSVTEIEFRIKAEIIKNQELQIDTQKKEIASLEKQLDNANLELQEAEKLKTKIEILKQKKFNLNQDLLNANTLIKQLQDKIENYETSKFDPTSCTINQLSAMILSRRSDGRKKNLSFGDKLEEAFWSKLKTLEAEKEDALEKIKTGLSKCIVALKELLSADENFLYILELLENGSYDIALDELRYKKTQVIDRMESTQFELTINENLMNSEELVERSYSTTLSCATPSCEPSPLCSPASRKNLGSSVKMRVLMANLEREQEENKNLTQIVEDLQEKLETAEIKAELNSGRDWLSYMQCQAAAIENILGAPEEVEEDLFTCNFK
ncbi:unnamed protein product [Blepharisma stoltei]|uniref:Uncharacterized protein n=1 Tax=Blepharisma stoltei TaxID=1481888 RepID=A0AAU9J2N2_9CILI|nr:unnamed protein product [Blepharisma stoltei]